MPPMIEAHGLTKRFKATEALTGLEFVVVFAPLAARKYQKG